MAKPPGKNPLNRMLGKKVVFHGKFYSQEDVHFRAMVVAQQGTVVDELDASVSFLVLLDLAQGKTLQKKAASLNAKGAAIQVLDLNAFRPMVEATADELLALIRCGKACAAVIGTATLVALFNRAQPPAPYAFASENFDGLDLSGAHLYGTSFEQCSFVGATLSKAHLAAARHCDFRKAIAKNASFEDVENSRFTGADLANALFNGNMANTDFSAANMEGATIQPAAGGVTGAEVKGCVFAGAVLRSAEFSTAWLKSPDFDKADLSGLTHTDMAQAGVRMIGLGALGYDARPEYNKTTATKCRKAGMDILSCTPEKLTEAMAHIIRG